MTFLEKLKNKIQDNFSNGGVSIAFFGDSVTQGCFELYRKNDGTIETFFDPEGAYHRALSKIFTMLCPNVPVNIINAGISGDNTTHACERLERDVLRYSPDLAIVCFGLNDACNGKAKLLQYQENLRTILKALKEREIEVIFLTPNMMNTEVSCHLKNDQEREIAEQTMRIQNDGIMDLYMDGARSVCRELKIPVCDCYQKWKRLAAYGIDTTELLANKINHPTRNMNWLFAISLAEAIFGLIE